MEYKFKGTPGPWEVVKGSISPDWIASIHIGGGDIVCDPPEAWEESMKLWDANKHLIAAAPELLEACIDTLRVIGEETPHSKQVKAAIQKALNL